MKVKKGVAILLTAMLCLSQSMTSMAKETGTKEGNIYYTNQVGVQMTKAEYDKLTELFSETEVAWMSQESADYAYKNCIGLISSVSLNQLVFETIKTDGSIKSTTVTISEKQAAEILAAKEKNPQEEIMPLGIVDEAIHNTAMKKITMRVNNTNELFLCRFSIMNEWKTLPAVRSYDIIAMRPGATSYPVMIMNDTGMEFDTYQLHDGTKTNYSFSGDHIKIANGAKDGKGGIGVSMNLSNTATGSITNYMSAYFSCADPLYSVFGTYQHATDSVSLAQSKKYSFGGLGMGSVLVFDNDTVKSKYDNTEGVHVTWDREKIY